MVGRGRDAQLFVRSIARAQLRAVRRLGLGPLNYNPAPKESRLALAEIVNYDIVNNSTKAKVPQTVGDLAVNCLAVPMRRTGDDTNFRRETIEDKASRTACS